MNPFRRRKPAPTPPAKTAATLWRVDQYAGQSEVRVQATQLDTHEPSAARRRRIYTEWVEFLATTETSITELDFVEPLASMPTLSQLTVSDAKEPSTTVLAGLVGLRGLCVGNASPGSDRSVVLPDLRWVVPLIELKQLDLPGTRILDPDLSPLLELPGLEMLRLPLRRSYRKQVFDFASHSPVFAAVASDYEE